MYNAVDANNVGNNFIQIIDNLFIKSCPIIIKSKRNFLDHPWMTTGLKNSCNKKKTTLCCIFEREDTPR